MMPSPPIYIRSSITICPNTLHVDAVGSVTSPVTQVEVVAVNSASIYNTDCPVAELMGSTSKTLPNRMAKRKLNKINCVVVN